jgi:hypothetical protein
MNSLKESGVAKLMKTINAIAQVAVCSSTSPHYDITA